MYLCVKQWEDKKGWVITQWPCQLLDDNQVLVQRVYLWDDCCNICLFSFYSAVSLLVSSLVCQQHSANEKNTKKAHKMRHLYPKLFCLYVHLFLWFFLYTALCQQLIMAWLKPQKTVFPLACKSKNLFPGLSCLLKPVEICRIVGVPGQKTFRKCKGRRLWL